MNSILCRACDSSDLEPVFSIPELTIAHRFGGMTDDPHQDFRHPLDLDFCPHCGTYQIRHPLPPDAFYVRGEFCFSNWKPQPHALDEAFWMREQIVRSGADPSKVNCLEIGCNDGLFLKTLVDHGFSRSCLFGIEPNPRSAVLAANAGFQIFRGYFDPACPIEPQSQDWIVARQVFEHIPDPRAFLKAALRALRPKGRLLLEVPDFESPLRFGDSGSLWEEHVSYFTEPSLKRLLARQGFEVLETRRYPFSGGALAVLAQPSPSLQAKPVSPEELTLARRFPEQIAAHKARLNLKLTSARNTLAVYGAGCRAHASIHALGLRPGLIIDDQPEKLGRRFPGLALDVRPSTELTTRALSLVLIAVNAENESKVLSRMAHLGLSPSTQVASLCSPSPIFMSPTPLGECAVLTNPLPEAGASATLGHSPQHDNTLRTTLPSV